ncbi:MAG: tail protein X [Synergistaceae bacterium]|nr:tail protein X [Synergistaceae bacterium]
MRTYTTKQGDTWDLIALRMYPSIGAEKLTDILIAANPKHVHTVIFSGGVELNIPDVEIPAITNLPAWKR